MEGDIYRGHPEVAEYLRADPLPPIVSPDARPDHFKVRFDIDVSFDVPWQLRDHLIGFFFRWRLGADAGGWHIEDHGPKTSFEDLGDTAHTTSASESLTGSVGLRIGNYLTGAFSTGNSQTRGAGVSQTERRRDTVRRIQATQEPGAVEWWLFPTSTYQPYGTTRYSIVALLPATTRLVRSGTVAAVEMNSTSAVLEWSGLSPAEINPDFPTVSYVLGSHFDHVFSEPAAVPPGSRPGLPAPTALLPATNSDSYWVGLS